MVIQQGPPVGGMYPKHPPGAVYPPGTIPVVGKTDIHVHKHGKHKKKHKKHKIKFGGKFGGFGGSWSGGSWGSCSD